MMEKKEKKKEREHTPKFEQYIRLSNDKIFSRPVFFFLFPEYFIFLV